MVWTWLAVVAVAMLPIPAEFIAAGAGMAHGPAAGFVLTWTGAMVGAAISFGLARRAGRPALARRLPARWMARIDAAADLHSSALFAVRLLPLVPFTALNWGLGLSPLRPWTFAWTTGLGILPGCLLFVYGGVGLGQLFQTHPAAAAAATTAAVIGIVLGERWRRRRAARR